MTERIRYTWGHSSLGDFIAAASDVGLVAFEFASRGTQAVDVLRAHFPEAVIEHDEAGLVETVSRLAEVVDHPDRDLDIPLDIRGTAYQKQVWASLREIPAGTTTNYGAVAANMGTRDARDVTEAIASNTIAILIPCHRVVKKDGSLSGYRWGSKRKRELLAREQRSGAFQLV
ncbi:methylated-DNA--[protein]-cysteine S-methyltransferase [Bradyrhizobium manausense]|uniref:methylated-DNA--[protein]-cysteine S-methyltransferase n=1 Tax=Bradyrhizobium manausense TaxID=989370 RepID=UPI00201318B0|nr:methylated-DNA--[protein]-cysteine S-methyltransferase [Bradyrhizobium manausense]